MQTLRGAVGQVHHNVRRRSGSLARGPGELPIETHGVPASEVEDPIHGAGAFAHNHQWYLLSTDACRCRLS